MWRKENVGIKRWRKGKEDYDDQNKQEKPHGAEQACLKIADVVPKHTSYSHSGNLTVPDYLSL